MNPAASSSNSVTDYQKVWLAIEQDDPEKLKNALQKYYSYRAFESAVLAQGRSPIRAVIGGGKVKILRTLIEHGCVDRDAVEGDRKLTLAHIAVETKQRRCLQVLQEQAFPMDHPDRDCTPPVHLAAQIDWQEGVQLFLKHDAVSVDNAINGKGQTLYHVAASCNSLQTLVALSGSDSYQLRQRDREGRTALHLAAMNGHLQAVRLLSQVGYDIPDRDGKTPKELATLLVLKAVADKLIPANEQKDFPSDIGVRLVKVVEWFNGPVVASVSIDDLMQAYRTGSIRGYIDMLLRSHLSNNDLNKCMIELMRLVTESDAVELLPYFLIELRCDPNFRTSGDVDSPLSVAASKGWLNISKMLLQAKADASQRVFQSGCGKQPFELVDAHRFPELRQLLKAAANPGSNTRYDEPLLVSIMQKLFLQ